MKRHAKNHRSQWKRLSQQALLLARRPKAAFYFVVLSLFVVVMSWQWRRSSWPTPPETLIENETSGADNQLEGTRDTSEQDRKGWDYFHPAWRENSDWGQAANKLPPDAWTVSEPSLRGYLKDPASRLETDFQVSEPLQERVLFWMRIHTQYSSRMRVIHDRQNPSIIYGVADFTSVFQQSDSNAHALTKIYRLERQILRELKARLSEAAGLTKTQTLSAWQRQELRDLLSHAGALGVAEAASLVHHIRSQTGQRDEFLLALSRSEQLLPYIERTFRSFDLPVALARIPFVESSFNARAHSKVGATGMWQFMPITAKQMISSAHPEYWSDPLRQTRAAARMLLIFRSMLPDWSTAVTAYNSGAGRLQRLVRKHHTKDISKLIEVQDPTGLGFAGKNFYAQFISACLVEAYQKELFPLRVSLF